MHDATSRPRPRVLYVEDDPDNLEAFTILLSSRYDVYGFTSGTPAIEAAPRVKPDVLLLDICMGPMTGLDCLREIRRLAEFSDVGAIALTGLARESERREFLDSGFHAVVVKPVLEFAELMSTIDGLLGRPPAQHTPASRGLPAPLATLDASRAGTAFLSGAAREERRRIV